MVCVEVADGPWLGTLGNVKRNMFFPSYVTLATIYTIFCPSIGNTKQDIDSIDSVHICHVSCIIQSFHVTSHELYIEEMNI